MMKDEIPPRRRVLRGVVAIACSWWVPAALTGCDSQKGANSTSPAPTGSSASSTASSAPAAAAKVSQASVQYQAQPKGDQTCSVCQHFIAESNTCKLVEGQISPEGWCILWSRKA